MKMVLFQMNGWILFDIYFFVVYLLQKNKIILLLYLF
jgi:hypothetical protein